MNMRWKCPQCDTLNSEAKHPLRCSYCGQPNPRWRCQCGVQNSSNDLVCTTCGRVSPYHEEEKEVLEEYPPRTRFDIALKKKVNNTPIPPKNPIKIVRNDDHVIPFRRPIRGNQI